MLNITPLNMLFTAANLLILFALMKKFLYQPVMRTMAKRQELLDNQFAQAEAMKKEAEQLKAQYQTYLSDTKEEQERILKEAKAQAGVEYDKILADADQKAKQILKDAKKAGQNEKEKAVKEAEAEITKMAVAAASKMVFQASDAPNNHDIYEEFLKKAGEKSGTYGN